MTTDDGVAVAAYRAAVEAAGLGDHADRLVDLLRPSVRLLPDLDAAPTGSRLGGLPELPPDVDWPTHHGEPLSLVAHLDLAELAPYAAADLPGAGTLSFFYDVDSQPWGFDPDDRGASAVLYTPSATLVEERDPPPEMLPEGVLRSVALRPVAELTAVPWESSDVEATGLSWDDALDRVASVPGPGLERIPGEPAHRLLGHPDPIQGDMQRECQLVSAGIYYGDATADDDPRTPELEAGATDWRLLLQVDSQEAADMQWGDGGRIYFWIRHADLVERRWDRHWLILQCD